MIKTFRLFLILNFSVLLYGITYSQNFLSVKQFSRANPSGIFGAGIYDMKMTTDFTGNTYITGFFTDTIDFDPGPGVYVLTTNNYPKTFIVKLDVLGNFIWAKQVGGDYYQTIGQNITVDSSGSVCITGRFNGTTDFDPDTSVAFNLTSAGNDDVFVLKLNDLGIFQWAFQLGSIGSEENCNIISDASGAIYLTGQLDYTIDFDPSPSAFNLTSSGGRDIFIAKYSNTGSLIWASKVGGINMDYSEGITIDSNGSIYVIGEFMGTVDLNPGPGISNLITSAGCQDVFILKLTNAGNFVWVKRFKGNNYINCTSIKVDLSGNIYSSGYFKDTVDFDPGPGINNLIATGLEDGFVVKLDNNGNLLQAKQFSGTNWTRVFDICIDQVGCIYATGIYNDTMDIDPGLGTVSSVTTGSNDFFLVKINTFGNFEWGFTLGGISVDNSNSICLDINNNIQAVGNFADTVDFDPGPGNYNLYGRSGPDMFLMKLTNTISTNTNYLYHEDDDVRMFPNPATEKITFEANQDIKELKLHNANGQVVFKSVPNASRYILNYNTPGLYTVQIITSEKLIIKRLLIVD